jgi:hypothetical protein
MPEAVGGDGRGRGRKGHPPTHGVGCSFSLAPSLARRSCAGRQRASRSSRGGSCGAVPPCWSPVATAELRIVSFPSAPTASAGERGGRKGASSLKPSERSVALENGGRRLEGGSTRKRRTPSGRSPDGRDTRESQSIQADNSIGGWGLFVSPGKSPCALSDKRICPLHHIIT